MHNRDNTIYPLMIVWGCSKAPFGTHLGSIVVAINRDKKQVLPTRNAGNTMTRLSRQEVLVLIQENLLPFRSIDEDIRASRQIAFACRYILP